MSSNNNNNNNSSSSHRHVSTQIDKWNALTDYINKWFYAFDMDAVKVALSLYCNHFTAGEYPSWCFILGDSSTGKSRVVMNPIRKLSFCHSVDSLVPSALMSGWGNGKQGLLHNLAGQPPDSHGVFVINDFSTVLNVPKEQRGMLESVLRDLFDGHYTKHTGNHGALTWEGKISIIAACTHSIDKHWNITQEFGERFIQYRMKDSTMVTGIAGGVTNATDSAVLNQIGYEDEIDSTLCSMVADLVDLPSLEDPIKMSDMVDILKTELVPYVSLCGQLRRAVSRDVYSPKKDIIEIHASGSSPRLIKQLVAILHGSMMLFRRDYITPEDIELAKSIAFSLIPRQRGKVITALHSSRHKRLDMDILESTTDVPAASLYRIVEELVAIKVVTSKRDKAKGTYIVTLCDNYAKECEHHNIPKIEVKYQPQLVVDNTKGNNNKVKRNRPDTLEDIV